MLLYCLFSALSPVLYVISWVVSVPSWHFAFSLVEMSGVDDKRLQSHSPVGGMRVCLAKGSESSAKLSS